MRFILSALLAGAFAASAADAAPSRVFAAELPFRDCAGLICVEVALDGHAPRTLMLDTGNANSTLISDAARELGWTPTPAQRDGRAVPGIFLGGEHRVALGALQAKAGFFVFDRDLLGEHRPPVDGSIAYDFFKDRVLEIDYPQRRLRISAERTTPVPERTTGGALKLINAGGRGPVVPVASGFTLGGKPLRAKIDTVFTGTLLIYDGAVDRLGLDKTGEPQRFDYTDGGVTLLAAPSPPLAFDGKAITPGRLYFPFAEGAPLQQPDGAFDAVAGNALFAHSVVTLDFHAMTLQVQPSR